jgi:hypothetical protein
MALSLSFFKGINKSGMVEFLFGLAVELLYVLILEGATKQKELLTTTI